MSDRLTLERSPAAALKWVSTPDRRKVVFAWLAVVALFVIGGIVKSGFASGHSISTILVVASFTGYVATGQMFVILIGGIDLSIPWVLNAGAILLVTSSLGHDSSAAQAVLLTLGLGLVVGLVNGLGVGYLGISAVVMTLAMNGIMQGAALGLTNGLTCSRCTASTPPVVHRAVLGSPLGIPNDLLLWLGVTALVTFVLSATVFGRRVYALGNNAQASFLAGINVKLVTVALYMLSGLFAALAGITLTAYGGQPTLGLGDPYLLQSVAAVVIGGVSILGGRGLFLGAVAGAIILTTLVTLLQALNMPDYGRDIVYGVVILAILLLYGRERDLG
ncbi:MAG TPA: ABC transporter permease [Nocardioidaceae bacterium]|nr:ABC transporter permease [Nocardioidaceae bacterium]